MLLASFLFALMATFVKLLPGIPVMEIIFFRALISATMCLYGIKKAGVSLMGSNTSLLVLRGIAGIIALSLNFYLLQVIPLAAASTLLHLAPIFTTLIGIWFVKEKISFTQFLFFCISFTGVILIQGFDSRISLFHLGLGFVTAMVMGFAYNCVRKLSKTEHPLVIIFYFPLMCLPVAGLWSALNWVQPVGIQWLYLFLVGLTTQVAQYFMTRSYQLARISTVSIVNYTGILYSIAIGYILFNENFNTVTYLGMALVIAGVMINILYQNKHKAEKSLTVK